MIEDSENTAPLPSKEVKPSSKIPAEKKQTNQSVAPLRPSPPNSQKRAPLKRLGHYQFSMQQKIGSGMSGDVYVGYNTQTKQLVCIKVVDRQVYKTSQQKKLLDNQIRCQTACNSQHTIKLLDVFDTSSFCFIVTEFCEGGDLYKVLKSSPNGLPEPVVSYFGLQIAKAMLKVKQQGMVHRDIKSENILLQKGQCKLGDFGFALEETRLNEHKFNLGSPLYMSLEALEKSQYSYASDVFAFGVVLFEMIHKESPWECSEEPELIAKMKTEEPLIKSGISQEMKSLILGCLKMKPEERPTIETILEHAALKELPLPPAPVEEDKPKSE